MFCLESTYLVNAAGPCLLAQPRMGIQQGCCPHSRAHPVATCHHPPKQQLVCNCKDINMSATNSAQSTAVLQIIRQYLVILCTPHAVQSHLCSIILNQDNQIPLLSLFSDYKVILSGINYSFVIMGKWISQKLQTTYTRYLQQHIAFQEIDSIFCAEEV